MAKLLIINPNTSEAMTDSIRSTVDRLNRNHDLHTTSSELGPESLESFYEYTLGAAGVYHKIKKMKMNEYDGVLLACFGDPGLYGLKEICDAPVVGIAESSFAFSILLGAKFSIIVSLNKAVQMMDNLIYQYGMNDRMQGIYPLDLPVLDLEREDEQDTAYKRLKQVAEKAVSDGAETIILGCAGMTKHSERLQAEVSIPVIDPVVAGYKALESIVESGMHISRAGLYKRVSDKTIVGFEDF